MEKDTTAAIVLAAGSGTRMESGVPKQYMDLGGRPLIYYALTAFERSLVEQVVLVVSPGQTEYCREHIVKRYGFHKVGVIVEGGKERYHSVAAGLKALKDCDYVLIHDGARPCLSQEIIDRTAKGARDYKACVAGMPVKDTIKVADRNEFAGATPDRSLLWQIQTPQAFEYGLVLRAYEKLMTSVEYQKGVTDDAMVVESMTSQRVKLIRGSYSNIKVTTPEDLSLAEVLLAREGLLN